MKLLQQQLGVPLFRSEGRGVALTDVGRAFLVDARQVLALADAGAAHARALHRGLTGRVRVGCSDDLTTGPLLERLLAFFAGWPGLQFELKSALSAQMLTELGNERLELVLCPAQTPGPAGLVSQVIGTVDIVAIVAASHPLAQQPALPPAALGGEALIILPATTVSSFGQTCRAILDDAGVVPAVTHSADNGQMAAAMAAAGLGIALATRSSVLLHEAVVAVPLESPRARINLMAVKRAGHASAGTSLLWSWLTEARPAAFA